MPPSPANTHTNGGGEAEAHCAEAAGGDDRAGGCVAEVARREHLVEAYVGDEYRIYACSDAHLAGHFAHVAAPFGVGGVELAVHHPAPLHVVGYVECAEPVGVLGLAHQSVEAVEHFAGVAVDAGVGLDVFVKFGFVDINMQHLGLRGIFRHLASHAVVEAHAYGYDQVGAVGVEVRANVAVHAHHAFVERMVGWHG